MHRTLSLFLLVLMQLPMVSQAAEHDSNFRLSLGRYITSVDPSASYSSDDQKQHFGWSIAGEMPQSNYTASRAIFYAIDDDRLGASGLEMQIMWGYGLAQPGFRIYAGPGFFFEHRTDRSAASDKFNTYRDFAISAGTGFQYKRMILDLNYQYRDPRSYERELKKRGGDESVDASTLNLSIGYQF